MEKPVDVYDYIIQRPVQYMDAHYIKGFSSA